MPQHRCRQTRRDLRNLSRGSDDDPSLRHGDSEAIWRALRAIAERPAKIGALATVRRRRARCRRGERAARPLRVSAAPRLPSERASGVRPARREARASRGSARARRALRSAPARDRARPQPSRSSSFAGDRSRYGSGVLRGPVRIGDGASRSPDLGELHPALVRLRRARRRSRAALGRPGCFDA